MRCRSSGKQALHLRTLSVFSVLTTGSGGSPDVKCIIRRLAFILMLPVVLSPGASYTPDREENFPYHAGYLPYRNGSHLPFGANPYAETHVRQKISGIGKTEKGIESGNVISEIYWTDPWNVVDYQRIKADPDPPGPISGNSPQCAGTGVTFTQGTCTTGCTCYWVSSATGTETTHSNLTCITSSSAGSYTVWIRARDNATGLWSPAVTATGTVFALPSPPANVTATPSTICQGGTSVLNALSDGNTIDWYTVPTGGSATGSGASGADFPVSPAGTTTYYAESRTPSGCLSASRTPVVVTVNIINPGTIVKGLWNPGPDCAPLNPNTAGSETDASGSGIITCSWEQTTDGGSTWTPADGTSTTSFRTFNPDPMSLSTSLRRMATSTFNSVTCSGYSNTLSYVVYPLPSVDPILPGGKIPVVCVGAQITLTNATPGGVWSSGDESIATVEGGVVTGISAGTVTIRYTVTDINSCSKTVTRSVHVLPAPSATLIYHS